MEKDERAFYPAWLSHSMQGNAAHDARLVAAMERHRMIHLLTFNTQHFVRYRQPDRARSPGKKEVANRKGSWQSNPLFQVCLSGISKIRLEKATLQDVVRALQNQREFGRGYHSSSR